MITLDGVSVRFGRAEPALRSVDARFDAGTSVALVGPNGSGKTTVLRLLAGLLEPSAGAVLRTGRPGVAYVAQHQEQHRWMPLAVAEVLSMSRYRQRGLLGPLRASDRRLVAEASERMEVAHLRNQAFGDLSGGQRQRVLVAGALAADAEVLLLDEPVTGLDIPSQRLILDAIDTERDAGRLVVVSTHSLDEARRCDRVMLLAGRVVADGHPDAVLVRRPLSEAFGEHLLDDVPVLDDHGHGSEPHSER